MATNTYTVPFFTIPRQLPIHSRAVSDATTAKPAQALFYDTDWYLQFQNCHAYFVDHAQHQQPVQALAAFINITLPFQRRPSPMIPPSSLSRQFASPSSDAPAQNPLSGANVGSSQVVSLTPYLRRLVATGYDTPEVLQTFFGTAWAQGMGFLHKMERRNFLFAAKSASWVHVKCAYDILPEETLPFLSPLKNVTEDEIVLAEGTWSEWLAMQDWMLGPRTPCTLI